MGKVIAVVLMMSLFVASLACAAGYNYLEADDFKKWLESGRKMTIVDIQPHADFVKHHFKGAVETNAFPAQSAEERARLDKVLPLVAETSGDVVVVCPRGGKGAKGAYDYLKEKGVREERLQILEDGMQGWPHKEMTVGGDK